MKIGLFLFNPDHDLALANHDVNYMPPASARQLAMDLAVLPAWYAGGGNAVLASSSYNLEFLRGMRVRFPQLASLLTEAEVATTRGLAPMPWGWDLAVYKRLLQLGMSLRSLPAEKQLSAIRDNSHRVQSVRMLERLRGQLHGQLRADADETCCGESFYLTKLDEIKAFVESRPDCLLKAPLSGSGKGLNWCKGIFTTHISYWCRNVIRQQGGVVAEPVYDKALDFAMLFHPDGDGRFRFSGYSLFSTNAGGAYEGNLLMSNEKMEKRLAGYVPLEVLDAIRARLEEHITDTLQDVYSGWLGVDMMVCRFPEAPEYRVHPCVEMNLRMTMGVVARLFYDRYVHPDVEGAFRIAYYPENEPLLAEHRRLSALYPLKLANGRIMQGYMPLVPVTPRARYSAYVLIDVDESGEL